VIGVSLAAGIATLFTLVALRYVCLIFRWLPRQDRWQRSSQGLCTRCGYDLRGNCSGTCPECGTTLDRIEQRSAPSGPSVVFDPQPWWVWTITAAVMICMVVLALIR
jgi:hypothetical protein